MAVGLLAACGSTDGPPPGSGVNAPMTTLRPDRGPIGTGPMGFGTLPKGGGHYKVGQPHFTNGRWYYPAENPSYDETGIATWYGTKFHGRKTANGEIYDMYALTTAHPTLPMPSYLEVTNLENGRRLLLRANDRGPFIDGRLLDVSWRAAQLLGFEKKGTAKVRVRYIGRAPLNGDDSNERREAARLQQRLAAR